MSTEEKLAAAQATLRALRAIVDSTLGSSDKYFAMASIIRKATE